MVFLSINFKELTTAQEGRQIREIISTPQGAIEVYEPTLDNISDIIDLQRSQDFGANGGVVSFDGITVVRTLFPLLTNIDMGDLTDEELEIVIDNPSIHLLIAQQIVAQIVAESNKLYAERVKTELMNTESTLAQVELMNTIPQMIVETAKRDGKVSELVEKVEQVGKELEDALKREQEQEQLEQEPADEPKI